jgi:hypothetical protein
MVELEVLLFDSVVMVGNSDTLNEDGTITETPLNELAPENATLAQEQLAWLQERMASSTADYVRYPPPPLPPLLKRLSLDTAGFVHCRCSLLEAVLAREKHDGRSTCAARQFVHFLSHQISIWQYVSTYHHTLPLAG